MIKKLTLKEVEKISELHRKNIKEAFFSKLGENFLIYLYTKYLKYENGRYFIGYCYCDEKEDVFGFVTCSTKKTFFSEFVRANLFNLIFNISSNMLKHPKSILSFFQTIICLLFDDVKEESEIFSIAVEEGHRDKKIGKVLIEVLFEELRNQKISGVKVLVDASIPANGFYQKCGFVFSKTLSFAGRKINVYKLQLARSMFK